MTTSARSANPGPTLSARALRVGVDDLVLIIFLEDGRSLSVPVEWFPRLAGATDEQRANWRLIGRGVGIHWPDLDEDISVANLLGAGNEMLVYRNGYEHRVEVGTSETTEVPKQPSTDAGRSQSAKPAAEERRTSQFWVREGERDF